ncbi:MAG: hypothetical protein QG662_366 [Pseudomonadota bacterium]|nr:hypothetical protein [Pseudomonadota bacterium]
MIVWLASYPRSGNTLLRTVLFKTMGLMSFSDALGQKAGVTAIALQGTGVAEKIKSGDWDEFYRKASESDEVFLVKTHRPPRDDQPAIYILRDGRKSCLSYSRYHQRFTPPPCPSLLDVVLGAGYFGGWSDHYRTWMKRGNTMLVRYEELVNAPGELLARLAETVRHAGEIAPWNNPFDELQQKNPDFFREGRIAWQGDPAWTPLIDAAFFRLHGDLMIELGYADAETVMATRKDIPDEWFELVDASRRFLAEKKAFEVVCAERHVVIDGLKKACDERQAVIDGLRLGFVRKLTRLWR